MWSVWVLSTAPHKNEAPMLRAGHRWQGGRCALAVDERRPAREGRLAGPSSQALRLGALDDSRGSAQPSRRGAASDDGALLMGSTVAEVADAARRCAFGAVGVPPGADGP